MTFHRKVTRIKDEFRQISFALLLHNTVIHVKIYQASAELPDTAVIGRLSHFGRVLSFCHGCIAQNLQNGIRTEGMCLYCHIRSTINLAGEIPYLPVYNAYPCIIRTLILATSFGKKHKHNQRFIFANYVY